MISRSDQSCPICGQKGRSVQTFTIRSLIKEPSLSNVVDDNYSFCANPDCDAVYYSDSKNSVFRKDQLKIRVGLKEQSPPRTLCYCFGHTMEEVHEEIRERGQSRVEKDISSKIEAGLCHCEDANPEGRCCLGRVAIAVKEGYRIYGESSQADSFRAVPGNDCCLNQKDHYDL